MDVKEDTETASNLIVSASNGSVHLAQDYVATHDTSNMVPYNKFPVVSSTPAALRSKSWFVVQVLHSPLNINEAH